jgi:hypothetical protein
MAPDNPGGATKIPKPNHRKNAAFDEADDAEIAVCFIEEVASITASATVGYST